MVMWNPLPWLLLLLCACAPPIIAHGPPPNPLVPYADHTRSSFASAHDFDAFAIGQNTTRAVKFVLPEFQKPGHGAVFLAPDFYKMHDEWYWFRLLNGQPVPGPVPEPLQGQAFASVAQVYQTFAGTRLPLDLIWVESRIYSVYFYAMALGDPDHDIERAFAVGTLLHLPPDPKRARPEELWLVLLEEQDLAGEGELQEMFRRLREALPPEIGQKLAWLPHPTGAQAFNARMWQQNDAALIKRIVSYADLVVPGKAEVYTPGLAAGRLFLLHGKDLRTADLPPNAIVVLDEIPDELPPVAAILTGVPQTPQAHLNLLAAARGTPNGYVGGIANDAVLKALAAAKVPVVMELSGSGFRYKPWTDVALDRWESLRRQPPPESAPRSSQTLPDVMFLGDDPTLTGPQAVATLVPAIGGKAAGIAALLNQPGINAPWRPMALTVNGFAQHLAPLQKTLKALMESDEFHDARARLLLLEGEQAFFKQYHGDAEARQWLAEFRTVRHDGAIDHLLARNGVQTLIQETAIDPRWLAGVTRKFEERFGTLADDQPLRFRSSSTAEDVEGFNAAGVYSSHSGYLFAARLIGEQQKATVARAIRRVWASYWSLNAWAERDRAGVPQLQPRMAVLVEPSFPDAMEVANGVALFALGLDAEGRPTAEMTLNVQPGALSVTNPPPGVHVVPEIDRVTAAGHVQRVQKATTQPQPILDDAQLRHMHEALQTLSTAWRDARNAKLADNQKALTVQLDLEFRLVADGWPKLRDGTNLPRRLVSKQVRPLSRAPALSERDVGAAMPVDVRAAAQKVVKRRCQLPQNVSVESVVVWTHPSAALLPYARSPLTLEMTIRVPPYPPLQLDMRQSNLTWAEWQAAQPNPPPPNAQVLLNFKLLPGLRLADSLGQLGDCTDVVMSSAPEQALRAWLEEP
jgi:hypothetical protein